MSASNPSEGGRPGRRKRLLLAACAGGVLLLAGGGAAAWWLLAGGEAQEEHAEAAPAPDPLLPPPEARFVAVPEIMTVLADPPRVGRLAVILEATPAEERQVSDAEMQRLAEELRRWLASQTSSELYGAASTWLARGEALAIARELYPDLVVRDVMVKTLLLQ